MKGNKGNRYFDEKTSKDNAQQDKVRVVKPRIPSSTSVGDEVRDKMQKWKEKKDKIKSGRASADNNEKEKNVKDSAELVGFGADKICFDSDEKKLRNFKTNQRRKRQKMRQKLEMEEKKKYKEIMKKKHLTVQRDPFPGDAPVPQKAIQKYKRGGKMKTRGMKTGFAKKTYQEKEKKLELAYRQAARSEMLMNEEAGFLQPEVGEDTTLITQHDIADAVDITSAQKHFDLTLKEFGPYRINYTRNGRFLLIGGNRGHVAAIDWQTKRLMCELNVMETTHDLKWLHQETMFAVAQKQWTYIYDNQGLELHCLKALDSVLRLEFLPFHFLLASSNSKGYLSWLDVSIGQQVAGHKTGLGRLDVMCQNPQNAILCLGHTGGTVSMWSPNIKEPVVKMLCHVCGVRSIAVDKAGHYMATSSIDRKLRIWDLRTYKMLQSYGIGAGAGSMAFSQTGLLALGKGNLVEVYKDCCRQTVTKPYLLHKEPSSIVGLQFCPYEDVLGVGHGEGFSSLLVPGAGEPNFDALEDNPFQSKRQRQEAEVQMLLNKIPAEMIHLDAGKIGRLDTKTYEEKVEEHNKIHFLKPKKVEFEPKYKMKGRNKTGRKENRKKAVQEEQKREVIKEIVKEKQKQMKQESRNIQRGPQGVLDRFKKKES